MKKRFVSSVLCVTMLAALLSGCGGDKATSGDPTKAPESDNKEATKAPEGDSNTASGDKVINVWSYTDEVPKMIEQYLKDHSDLGYSMKSTIIATTDGAYQPAIDQALTSGSEDAPDIYCAESAFVKKYTQGDASSYAMPYEDLGIDVEKGIKDGEIAQYTVDLGTNKDGKVTGLAYQATGGAYIYRRSIAKEVWGTDDPTEVAKKLGNDWESFFKAAEELKAKGYGIVSGDGDIWHAIENSSEQSWVTDGLLTIDPKREKFLDYAKVLKDKGYSNDTQDWQDAWFADMKDAGSKKVFGFFGPAWLINYTIAPNSGGKKAGEGTYGDWGVCPSPVGFFWGGTWILANKELDDSKKEAVKDIINWITLDTTEDGLQYKWANGTLYGEGGTKDAVASNVVMSKSNGSLEFLGGQNMFDVFIEANKSATGKNKTQYDESINAIWRDQARQYTEGKKSKEEALAEFKKLVSDKLGIESE